MDWLISGHFKVSSLWINTKNGKIINLIITHNKYKWVNLSELVKDNKVKIHKKTNKPYLIFKLWISRGNDPMKKSKI